MKRILIADDHAVVRRGVKDILEDEFGQIISGEAQDFPGVLKHVEEQDWDLLILDVSMPGGNVLDTLGAMAASHPHIPVLVLSMHPEEQYAVRLLKAGAAGYLTKESLPDELIAAVDKALSRKKYVSASLAGKLVNDLVADAERPLHESLSNREFQVMLGIASGTTVKEIAEEQSLSVKTISTYRSRVLEKMNMKTNADIIRYAIENRLIE